MEFVTEYINIKREGNSSTMEKKKLCYFINSAWYFELHWLDRAKAALDAGYEVSVIANFANDEILGRLEAIGFKCYDSQMNEKSINPLWFIKDFTNLFKILNRINPDILHSITIKPGVISCIWCKLRNKKLIYSFVGLGRVFENSSIVYRALRFVVIRLYRTLFTAIDCKIIFEHEADQKKIINLIGLDQSKTIVIDGAGIDINHFTFSEEQQSEPPKILFASRMLWSKGLGDLVQVKNILKHDGLDIEILVAGIIIENDDDAISLNQIQKWNDSGDIVWLGTRNDVKELIQLSNIVALPSIYGEGVPRILLEAGAVGRAAITYDVSGCNSLIEDGFNGIVVEKKNIEQFTIKLKKMILDKESRRTMGLNARVLIEKKYSSEIIITETLLLYSSRAC